MTREVEVKRHSRRVRGVLREVRRHRRRRPRRVEEFIPVFGVRGR